MTDTTTSTTAAEWHKTVCILCSANCGVELKLDGREITRVRGNKSHVASLGYTCEKALRLNHYQNGMKRLQSPMRREADGSYTTLDWKDDYAGTPWHKHVPAKLEAVLA